MVQARRFICFVFLRVLENVSMVRGICIDIDLIEAKQSDETNKREGMQASSLISSLLLLLHHFVAIEARSSFHWSHPWSTLNLFTSILRDTVSPWIFDKTWF